MKLLLSSFGGSLPYVAGAILVAVMVLLILAFRQGRTIEFWPPRIGSRPDGTGETVMDLRDGTGLGPEAAGGLAGGLGVQR